MVKVLTAAAFAAYRAARMPKPMHVDVPRYAGDCDLLTSEEGLLSWEDGSGAEIATTPPEIEPAPAEAHLWAVTHEDVVHAPELCPFGADREAGRIKHSNLTGGGDAYCGGELLVLNDNTVVINGCSGRYRMRDAAEMRAVASAFRGSGYNVWSMGWNTDVDRPAMFGTQDPEWVAA